MNTRFYNAKILKIKDLEYIDYLFEVVEGELWVEGNRITHIGKVGKTTKSPEFDQEIDTQGNLLMPGFKNAHTH